MPAGAVFGGALLGLAEWMDDVGDAEAEGEAKAVDFAGTS